MSNIYFTSASDAEIAETLVKAWVEHMARVTPKEFNLALSEDMFGEMVVFAAHLIGCLRLGDGINETHEGRRQGDNQDEFPLLTLSSRILPGTHSDFRPIVFHPDRSLDYKLMVMVAGQGTKPEPELSVDAELKVTLEIINKGLIKEIN